MKKLLLTFHFILNPKWWSMNYSFNKGHDILLNKLLDKYEFKEISQYTAKLGNYTIWISNYPYAVGIDNLYRVGRPSRYTIYKMNKHLEKAIANLSI